MADVKQAAADLLLQENQFELVDEKLFCVVNKEWLCYALSKKKIPSSVEATWLLWPADVSVAFGELESPWLRMLVQVIETPSSNISIPLLDLTLNEHELDENIFEFLGNVAQNGMRQKWNQLYHKYSTLQSHLSSQQVKQVEEVSLVNFIQKIYKCPVINSVEDSDTCAHPIQQSWSCHGSLTPVLCMVNTPKRLYLLQPIKEHTIQSCIIFSPAMLTNSFAKPMFIIYQIIQAVNTLHRHGLLCGNINLNDFLLHENMGVQFLGPRWAETLEFSLKSPRVSLNSDSRHIPDIILRNKRDSLSSITEKWVLGEVSNFDYLIILNEYAGRRMGNPNYHPVIPWVADFTSPDGGFRELGKSKYRLNKGDQQLDLTFETSISLKERKDYDDLLLRQAHIPHHISDMLSDITYYVYKARRTSKAVLCRFVRKNWVPGEYPSSMHRMQAWTPDECIPEFFTDPTIFKSVHEDLPDLEVPYWCSSGEDFISWHRQILESPFVSQRLHRWIDLTFGYKLSGIAAKKSLNVFLHLVDQHTTPEGWGVVQLFDVPHPKKVMPSPYMSLYPPNVERNILKTTESVTVLQPDLLEQYSSVPISKLPLDVQPSSSVVSETQYVESVMYGSSATGRIQDTNQNEGDKITDSSFSSSIENVVENSEAVKRGLSLETALGAAVIDDGTILRNPIKKLPFFRKSELLQDRPLRPEEATIKLPDDYDPLSALNQLEALHAFTSRTIHGSSSSKDSKLATPVEDFEEKLKRDMLAVGCTIAEIFLGQRLILHQPRLPLEERKRHIHQLLVSDLKDIPRPCQHLVQVLLDYDSPAEMKLYLQHAPSSYFLSPFSDVVSFPKYFPELHQLGKELQEADNKIQTLQHSCHDNKHSYRTNIDKLNNYKIHITRKLLPDVLLHANEEGKEMLLLYIQELFQSENTGLFAILLLFNKLSLHLGPRKSVQNILGVLQSVYESEHTNPHFVRMYHRYFLSQLIVRLGLKPFLKYLVKYVILALNGVKSCPIHEDLTDENGVILRSVSLTSDVIDLSETDLTNQESGIVQEQWENGMKIEGEEDDDAIKDMNILNQDEDEEMAFDDDAETDFSEEKEISSADIDSENGDDEVSLDRVSIEQELSIPVSQDSGSRKNSGKYLEEAITDINKSESLEINRKGKESVSPALTTLSDVALESISWLARRIGPSLSGVYITKGLLEGLSQCYSSQECMFDSAKNGLEEGTLVGDVNAKPVIQSLINIYHLYGDQFIFQQYLPYLSQIIKSIQKKVLASHEASLVGSFALWSLLLPHIPQGQLLEKLQLMQNQVVLPAINLISSPYISFPSGSTSRRALCRKFIEFLTQLTIQLGREETRNRLKGLMQYFFLSFDIADSNRSPISQNYERKPSFTQSTDSDDLICEIRKDSTTDQYKVGTPKKLEDLKGDDPEFVRSPPVWARQPSLADMDENPDKYNLKNDANIMDQLRDVFTPEMAHLAYVPLCRLAGSIHMEDTLYNHDYVRSLSDAHEEFLLKEEKRNSHIALPVRSLPVFSENDGSPGGLMGTSPKLQDSVIKDKKRSTLGEDLMRRKSSSSDHGRRKLAGTWLNYWEQYIADYEDGDSFHLCQLKLQTFEGHAAGVKVLQVMPNENSFASASRDKTVKLWSIRNHGDGNAVSSCNFTYPHHKKPVFALNYLESQRLIASCDGNVYVWDPFGGGAALRGYDLSKSVPTCMTSMPPPNPVLVLSTPDATVRILDIRQEGFQHELKVTSGPLGLIRCLSVSPDGNTLGVGLSSGVLSMVDLRTGLLLGGWRAHEGEILQIKAHTNRTFVTSSVDCSMAMWRDDGSRLCTFRGVTEPVNYFCLSNNQIISATTSCRIGIHTSIDQQANYSSTKLRSDVFKGVLTSMDVLPLNKLLLLGSDNGQIVLIG